MASTTSVSSSSSTSFQIGGLGSGVDTGAMVDALREYRMRPVTLEQAKQDLYTAKQQTWMDLNVRLLAVQTSVQSLTRAATFSAVKAASSESAVADVTATSSATPGSMNLTVSQLAQARKVASNEIAASSATAALGYTGSFSVNGKVVSVATDDSLSALATKINALGAGASATLVEVTPGKFKMTLAGTATGAQDALSLADLGGADTVLKNLGFLNGGAAGVRYAPGANMATSNGFSSSTAKIGTLTGLTATSGTFKINGAGIAYDTANDSLADLAARINATAGAGATATVVTDSSSKQRLQITGVTATSFDPDANGAADDDPNGLLGLLGITQTGTAAGNVLADAQDAKFTLDNNLTIQRPTNTITDVLPGVTLTLKKGGGATSSLSFAQDTQTTVDAVNSFVSAYNDAMGKIQAQFVYTEGAASPALFGDFTLQQIQNDLASSLTSVVSGQPAGFATLRDVGIELQGDGSLTVDTTTLGAQLAKDPAAVSRLFTQFGTADNASVSYLSSSADTQVSTAGYDIQVTQLAEKASVTAGHAAAASSDGPEVLTFSGALFANVAKTVTLSAGNTIDATIAQINASAIGKYLLADKDGSGKLVFRSLDYGTAQNFTVVSDKNAADNYSGIGTTVLNADNGKDVVGTIGGETATGRGRTLTGNQPNGAAKDLAVRIAATVLGDGSFGKVTMQRGMAATLANVIGQITAFATGTIAQQNDSLQSRIDDSKQRAADLTASVDSYIANLQQQFTRMETQISKLKSQSSSLAQTIEGLNNSNKNN